MKTCRKCKQAKPLTEFTKHAAHKDGLKAKCKTCANADSAKWRKDNPGREKAYGVARRAVDADRLNAASAAWYAANKDRAAEHKIRWKKLNPERHKVLAAAGRARRRAASANATPAWANKFFMEEAYDLARRRTKVFCFSWHVDHIVPLCHKLVCGLHVPANLQVIPGVENLSKGNRNWPDTP